MGSSLLLSTGFQSLSGFKSWCLTDSGMLQDLISDSVGGRCSHFSQSACEDEVKSCPLADRKRTSDCVGGTCKGPMAEKRPEARMWRSKEGVALSRFREARFLPHEGFRGEQASPWCSGAHNLRRIQVHKVTVLSGCCQE